MANTKKEYAIIDEYGTLYSEGTFDNYQEIENEAQNEARMSRGVAFYVIECKRVTKVFVPENPNPIITKL